MPDVEGRPAVVGPNVVGAHRKTVDAARVAVAETERIEAKERQLRPGANIVIGDQLILVEEPVGFELIDIPNVAERHCAGGRNAGRRAGRIATVKCPRKGRVDVAGEELMHAESIEVSNRNRGGLAYLVFQSHGGLNRVRSAQIRSDLISS